MSFINPWGDFEITDPRAMRALAHPVRLAALTQLQRNGPATATQLATLVGASPSVVSWHLRHLAEFGLVTDWDGGTDARERWWQAAAKGIRFELPSSDEARADFDALSGELFAAALDQASNWLAETRPQLETDWLSGSGVSNTSLLVTRDELRELAGRIEDLLLPLLASQRDRAAAGEEAQVVRFIRFTLPEASEGPAQTGE
jgi:DNA-binding transcriptional ArsR family regulator